MTANRNTLWYCRDGTSLRLRDMTDSHLQNAHALFTRFVDSPDTCQEVYLDDDMWGSYYDVVSEREWHGREIGEWLEMLEAELKRRERTPTGNE